MRGLPWPEQDASGSCWGNVAPSGGHVMYSPCGRVVPSLADSYVFLDVARRRVRIASQAIKGIHSGVGSWRTDQPTFLRADGRTIREFDTRSARLLQKRRMDGPVGDVAYSPDGTVAVAGQFNGDVTLLDADSLEPLASPLRVDAPVFSVGVAPDNRTAFAVTTDRPPGQFWQSYAIGWALLDLQQGVVTHEGGLGFYGNWGTMSPTGDRAAVTGIGGGEVLIIDLVSGKPVRPFVRAHPSNVSGIAFSPDGSRLMTGGLDGSVVLWDAETATEVARVSLPTPGAAMAGFRPDGTLLLAQMFGADPAVYVWGPSPERAAEFACRAAGRELTEEEWSDTFGDLPYQEVCAGS